uniref:Secreted protein n=1 Tax=Picea sitchensis TaxID=3332 RepID=B8LKV9_PICSI|nr:unknown [Picea sitchensis]
MAAAAGLFLSPSAIFWFWICCGSSLCQPPSVHCGHSCPRCGSRLLILKPGKKITDRMLNKLPSCKKKTENLEEVAKLQKKNTDRILKKLPNCNKITDRMLKKLLNCISYKIFFILTATSVIN